MDQEDADYKLASLQLSQKKKIDLPISSPTDRRADHRQQHAGDDQLVRQLRHLLHLRTEVSQGVPKDVLQKMRQPGALQVGGCFFF